MIEPKDWKWKGLAGHFICADSCIFRLHTQIGKYKVSTVGAMYTKSYKDGKEMYSIGCDRHYETMVFELDVDGLEVDFEGIEVKDFSNPESYDEMAEDMHMRMCLKYAEM